MIAFEQAQNFELDLSPSSWYDLWHTHVDWEGEGNFSVENRAIYLYALFTMFEKALEQTKCWEKPSNVWVLVVPENAEEDALYIHTPNPNKKSEFPYSFKGVAWSAQPPEFLRPFLKATYEVGVSEYNGTMYWIRQHVA